jgi:hypothetical protein
MYTFTKLPIEDNSILDGIHLGKLFNIEDTFSKGGDRMLKLNWKIGDEALYDYLLPEHPNEVCRRIAQQKISSMGENMLGVPDNQEFDIRECISKEAYLNIKSKEGMDGKMYPRVIAIKKPPKERGSISGKILPVKASKEIPDIVDDDCPF